MGKSKDGKKATIHLDFRVVVELGGRFFKNLDTFAQDVAKKVGNHHVWPCRAHVMLPSGLRGFGGGLVRPIRVCFLAASCWTGNEDVEVEMSVDGEIWQYRQELIEATEPAASIFAHVGGRESRR